MPEAHICAGVRRDGGPCTATVIGPQAYCYHHDPALEQERRERASNAAKSKSRPSELDLIITKLQSLADQVQDGSLDKGRASVIAQLLGVALRGIETRRKVKETEEVAAMLEELEQAQRERQGRFSA
jgi:hypothetical protein